jgi:hypothetical protein
VEWLEEHGLSAVSVKERDVSGRTLLFYASYDAHDSAVITRLLLSTKPSVETVNAQDERGETALHYAVRCFFVVLLPLGWPEWLLWNVIVACVTVGALQ